MKTYKADTKNYFTKKTGSVTFEAEDFEAARKKVVCMMEEWRGDGKYYIEQVVKLTEIETGKTL